MNPGWYLMFAGLIFLAVSTCEYRDAVGLEQGAPMPPAQSETSCCAHPLPYTATVTQYEAAKRAYTTRYYVPRRNSKETQ